MGRRTRRWQTVVGLASVLGGAALAQGSPELIAELERALQAIQARAADMRDRYQGDRAAATLAAAFDAAGVRGARRNTSAWGASLWVRFSHAKAFYTVHEERLTRSLAALRRGDRVDLRALSELRRGLAAWDQAERDLQGTMDRLLRVYVDMGRQMDAYDAAQAEVRAQGCISEAGPRCRAVREWATAATVARTEATRAVQLMVPEVDALGSRRVFEALATSKQPDPATCPEPPAVSDLTGETREAFRAVAPESASPAPRPRTSGRRLRYGGTDPLTGIVYYGGLEYQGQGAFRPTERMLRTADTLRQGRLPGSLRRLMEGFLTELAAAERAATACDRDSFGRSRARLESMLEQLQAEYHAEKQELIQLNHDYRDTEARWNAYADTDGDFGGALIGKGTGSLMSAGRLAILKAGSVANPFSAVLQVIPSVLIALRESGEAFTMWNLLGPRLLAMLEIKLYYDRGVIPRYSGVLATMRTSLQHLDERLRFGCREGDCREGER